jgi:branched-chain amino acid transport system permease protein
VPAGVFKERYAELMAHLRYPIHWAGLAAAAVFLLLLPAAGAYPVSLAVDAAVFLVAAIGLNITTGLAGQISLAQGALMGVGAYTVAKTVEALASGGHGVSGLALALIPAAGFAAAAVGLLLALPSFRLKGYYLAMASLAAQVLLVYIFKTVVDPYQGITVPDEAKTLAGVYFGSGLPMYYLVVAAAELMALLAANVGRSSLGRAMKAVRDNDVSASIVGIDVARTKALAFALGAFYAGVAGALYALSNNSVAWDAFELATSIDLLAMVLVGGAGRIVWGSLLGVLLLRTFWSNLDAPLSNLSFVNTLGGVDAVKYMVFGLLVAYFVVKEPEGLIGVLRRVKEYLRLWPFSY